MGLRVATMTVTPAIGSFVSLSVTTPSIAPVVTDCACAARLARIKTTNQCNRISPSLDVRSRSRHDAPINPSHTLRATIARVSHWDPSAPRDSREIAQLTADITACRRCARLVRCREAAAREPPRRFVDHAYWARPISGFGDPDARLLVVGLAPAA